MEAPISFMETRTKLDLVVDQGEVVVGGGAWIEQPGDRVVAGMLDLGTKRAELCGYGYFPDDGPSLCLCAGPDTLGIDEAQKGKMTMVRFPKFIGWQVHCADVARYTVSFCLIKVE